MFDVNYVPEKTHQFYNPASDCLHLRSVLHACFPGWGNLRGFCVCPLKGTFSTDSRTLSSLAYKCRLGSEFIKPTFQTTNPDSTGCYEESKMPSSQTFTFDNLAEGCSGFWDFLYKSNANANASTLLTTHCSAGCDCCVFDWEMKYWRLAHWPFRICIHMQIHSWSTTKKYLFNKYHNAAFAASTVMQVFP